jgi:hypothetical protein
MNDLTTTSPPAIANAKLAPGGVIAALIPQSLEDAFRLAKALAAAGDMVPKHFQGNPEATMAAIIRGLEIGLAPMQALSNIAVINGRASVWGDALPALMQRAGHQLDCTVTGEGDEMSATATLIRGDTGQTIVRTFAAKDAKAAGLWGKAGPWQLYKPRMLSMRARTLACRDGAADALMGLQVAEEVQDYPKDVTPREPGPLARMALAARAKPVEPDAPQEAEILPDPAAQHWTASYEGGEGIPGSKAWGNGLVATVAEADCPYAEGTQDSLDWLDAMRGARRAGE